MKPSQTNFDKAEIARRGSGRPLKCEAFTETIEKTSWFRGKRHKIRANYWLIGFFILQIGIDLAHSVTVFPFVHYGMFSASVARPDSVEVFRVSVDGRLLQPGDLAIYRWDMVGTPLEAYERRLATGDYAFDKEKLQAGMARAGLSSLYNQLKSNLYNTGSFIPWYKGYLGRLLGQPIGILRVDKAWYRWAGGGLQLVRTENWING
ncbi:MAG TPA: hypothetical protein VKQ52_13700 [Puia sp.]|nr:hypothetical protein [Puia sp.]